MEPLQELFDLYEAMKAQKKPPLKDEGEPAVGNPKLNYDEDPIVQGKDKVDALRVAGASAGDAHEQVHGEVDTSDANSKAEFAKTLGRVQQDGDRTNIHVERDAEHKSLLAKDEELEKKLGKTTDNDMKTPISKEIPDALEEPEKVDTKEEVDYNDDVTYLQTYGRA
jgi:hypothetical protein